jgi:hypothetical protein
MQFHVELDGAKLAVWAASRDPEFLRLPREHSTVQSGAAMLAGLRRLSPRSSEWRIGSTALALWCTLNATIFTIAGYFPHRERWRCCAAAFLFAWPNDMPHYNTTGLFFDSHGFDS